MAKKSTPTLVTSPRDDVAVGGSPAGMDWLMRAEVAAAMDVSIATVRRLEGSELHPRRSPEGFYLFDPREVEAARARRPPPPAPIECSDPGAIAAEAFKLLRDGADVRDLVIALRRPPKEIEALYADWERIGDMRVISWRIRSQLRRMVHHGLLSEDILDAIEEDDADRLSGFVSAAIEELDGG